MHMSAQYEDPAELGDLIAAAFDEAARFSNDPREVSRLATQAITHMLEGVRKAGPAHPENPAALGQNFPAAQSVAASLLHLVPDDGPRVRLRGPSRLRLIPCNSASEPRAEASVALHKDHVILCEAEGLALIDK